MNKIKVIAYKGTFLTLANYKEPLREVDEGYGYYGALLSTTDGTRLQCHVCGELFSSVGAHAAQKHKLKARDYKQRFHLAFDTALVSEEERERLKQRTLDWLNSLTPRQKELLKQKAIRGAKKAIARLTQEQIYSKMSHPQQLETKNKRGTCPDQLLAKIKEAKAFFKRTPTSKEFVDYCGSQRYKHLIFKVFGSWNHALKQLNLAPAIPNSTRKTQDYTEEELLLYLKNFAKKNNKIPTATDFRRGVLPNYQTYTRRFGSIEEARQQAGVYDIIH